MAMTNTSHTADIGISLSGIQETLFITLVGKYNDFFRSRPLLADRWAVAILDHLDPQQQAALVARVPSYFKHSPYVPMRSYTIDTWAASFLARHRDQAVAVVHLGCGLDARALRLRGKCGVNVLWIDLDLPDVIDARRRVAACMPEPAMATAAGEAYSYQMVAADVTAEGWLKDLPTDRPTLVLIEGLIMYLRVKDAEGLLRRLRSHFEPGGGELVVDLVSPQMATLQKWPFKILGDFDAPFGYTPNSFQDVLKSDKRLQLVEGDYFTNWPVVQLLGSGPRVCLWFLSWIPYFSGLFSLMRLKI
ncbi:tetracenomycin polyketide synthesis O-methyltransferase [Cordyceps militaris]|uniref:Tetracenomycin polyketide synthesis O-methyltransferase n=1 Tax=Cordyceps militaris TaxID=73501 RepID=A0A2H4SAR2_CORMI|nr:tetracenomycin polyketide synthesis O-methyltransferase [Cordyceps militaris]